MYTLLSLLFVAGIMTYVNRTNQLDRKTYAVEPGDMSQLLLLHVRQDLRLVAYLLAAAIVMLGLVADRGFS